MVNSAVLSVKDHSATSEWRWLILGETISQPGYMCIIGPDLWPDQFPLKSSCFWDIFLFQWQIRSAWLGRLDCYYMSILLLLSLANPLSNHLSFALFINNTAAEHCVCSGYFIWLFFFSYHISHISLWNLKIKWVCCGNLLVPILKISVFFPYPSLCSSVLNISVLNATWPNICRSSQLCKMKIMAWKLILKIIF